MMRGLRQLCTELVHNCNAYSQCCAINARFAGRAARLHATITRPAQPQYA
jgi:hypothetical protein